MFEYYLLNNTLTQSKYDRKEAKQRNTKSKRKYNASHNRPKIYKPNAFSELRHTSVFSDHPIAGYVGTAKLFPPVYDGEERSVVGRDIRTECDECRTADDVVPFPSLLLLAVMIVGRLG